MTRLPNHPIRAGIVGSGKLAQTHLECIRQIEGIAMVAYCDIMESRAQAYLEKYRGDYATTDLDRMLEDPTINSTRSGRPEPIQALIEQNFEVHDEERH